LMVWKPDGTTVRPLSITPGWHTGTHSSGWRRCSS
jgi:hypothetical protein